MYVKIRLKDLEKLNSELKKEQAENYCLRTELIYARNQNAPKHDTPVKLGDEKVLKPRGRPKGSKNKK